MEKQTVIRDVIVVLPGIMGSTLSKNGELIWAPSAGAVLNAITTFGRSICDMTLPQGIGDDHPKDGVEPVAIMPDLHFLPGIWTAHIGYDELLGWLRTRFHFVEQTPGDSANIPNLLPFAYDWRLSNRYNGRRLKAMVEPALERWRAQGGMFAEAKLIFICHSMGGLVARWFIEMEGGAEITRKLVTIGTPYRGALNALDVLVNGVKKDIGPLKLNLSLFARSLPSLHQLLPEYACIESTRGLLKTTETTVPELETAMITNAMRFHNEMDDSDSNSAGSFDIYPIVGIRQDTFTTARIVGGTIEPTDTISGENEGGDATVPRLAAIPKSLKPDSPTIHFIADQHGALQSNQAVLDEIEGVLTANPNIYRDINARLEIGVRTEPIVLMGQCIHVEATVVGRERVTLMAEVINEQNQKVACVPLRDLQGVHDVMLDPLPPGAYRVVVGGIGSMAFVVNPVITTVLVWGKEAM